MLSLPNNCRCSEITVTPKNWNCKGASTKKTWRVYYRFYEPGQDPWFEEIRAGINYIKDLNERRNAVKDIIASEKYRLIFDGYNPRLKVFFKPDLSDIEIDPQTPFIIALNKALPRLQVVDQVRLNIKSAIKYIAKAAVELHYDIIPISLISKKYIKNVLLQCKINKGDKWSGGQHNMYRAYLDMLFKELGECEAVIGNPVTDISKQKVIQKLKVVLDEDQRKEVNEHLYKNNYRFWLFVNLYFHSGGRGTELLKLKGADVDLKRQVYKTIILKGRNPKEVERTIKDIALPFWMEMMQGCGRDEYIFSKKLNPGAAAIHPRQLSKRWRRWVKNPKSKNGLGINVDFYKLKHLNSTQTIDQLQMELNLRESQRLAAQQNGHTSEAMVVKIYDVNNPARRHEQLKKVNNKFA
jgi:integrase